MRINKLSRSKIEVVDGDRKVVIEVAKLSKNYVVTVSDGVNTSVLTVRNIETPRVVSSLAKFGVSDVHRVLSHLLSMTSEKLTEADKAVFMKVEDVVIQPDGGQPEKVGETVKTYFHTVDGEWRVFSNDWDVVQGQLPFQLREVEGIATPSINVQKVFLHYNTADVDAGVVHDLCRVATEVKEVLQQYVVLEERYYDVVAAWVVGTYVRWASSYSEMLVIRKTGFGAGGSTLLKTAAALSARPMPLSIYVSPAAFYRVVDFAMPTVPVDEIREDELPSEYLRIFKLLAESSYDRSNRVPRVVDGEVRSFSTYANVILVDTTDKFITYSAERRAWTAVVRPAMPPRYFELDDVLKSTEDLRERLYALGVAMPTVYYRQWKTLTAEQGLGVLKFLERAARHLCGGAEVFESALSTVVAQLEYAKQTSLLSDPKRMVLENIERIIAEAKRELGQASSSPSNATDIISIVTPEDPEYKCGFIYLQKLVRLLRQRFMEVWQADTRKVDSVYYATSEVRLWYRVSEDVEMYLKPAKIKTLLTELGIKLEFDSSRNYYIRVCR
ncbi:MAG: hypothetical protein ACO2PN_29145 [Pyrobaculum sp.]|jgi:hypothetical protein